MTPLAWAVAGVVYHLAYSGLEYWLGRTDKVKAGSVLEAVWNVAKVVLPKGK